MAKQSYMLQHGFPLSAESFPKDNGWLTLVAEFGKPKRQAFILLLNFHLIVPVSHDGVDGAVQPFCSSSFLTSRIRSKKPRP